MRTLIISDVHANPVALKGVLDENAGLKVVFLGDVTGYGYDPVECIRLLKAAKAEHLLGNHDVVALTPDEKLSIWDKLNSHYAMDRVQGAIMLKDAEREWIRGGGWVYEGGTFAAAHGDFTSPAAFEYIDSVVAAAANFNSRPEQLMFVGHTHESCVWVKTAKGKVERREFKSFTLRDGWRYIVNVGSVGYPRADGVTTYCIYDAETRQVKCCRRQFDFESFKAGIQRITDAL